MNAIAKNVETRWIGEFENRLKSFKGERNKAIFLHWIENNWWNSLLHIKHNYIIASYMENEVIAYIQLRTTLTWNGL